MISHQTIVTDGTYRNAELQKQFNSFKLADGSKKGTSRTLRVQSEFFTRRFRGLFLRTSSQTA